MHIVYTISEWDNNNMYLCYIMESMTSFLVPGGEEVTPLTTVRFFTPSPPPKRLVSAYICIYIVYLYTKYVHTFITKDYNEE